MNIAQLESFNDSFEQGSQLFGQSLDRTNFTTPVNIAPSVHEIGKPAREDFYQVPREFLPLFVGRILLSPNKKLRALSPAVLLPGNQTYYELTRLNQPYEPTVGCTAGIQFGLSAVAQTKDNRFGGHATEQGGFEAGHFSSALIASKNIQVGEDLRARGDAATHTLLLRGIAPTMSGLDMLPMAYQTAIIPSLDTLALFWHPSLETNNGTMTADFPGSIRLVIGAGIASLGRKGIDTARTLVDAAIAGANK